MLQTFIIVFREILEAGLIIGIALSATRGILNRHLWVMGGIAGGIAFALMLAFFAGNISDMMEGIGQEILNAGILSTAVVMLAWHNIWMASHGRELSRNIKQVGHDISVGDKSLMALAIVVGTAVMREGAEIVLFLYGIAVSGTSTVLSMQLGGLLGLITGGLVSAVTYFGLVRIPSKHLFRVTSWLIALLAAGMASQVVALLQQAQLVEIMGQTVWDTSAILAQDSAIGQVLHILIGYNEQPTLLQIVVYVVTLGTIFGLMKLVSISDKHHHSVQKSVQMAN